MKKDKLKRLVLEVLNDCYLAEVKGSTSRETIADRIVREISKELKID